MVISWHTTQDPPPNSDKWQLLVDQLRVVRGSSRASRPFGLSRACLSSHRDVISQENPDIGPTMGMHGAMAGTNRHPAICRTLAHSRPAPPFSTTPQPSRTSGIGETKSGGQCGTRCTWVWSRYGPTGAARVFGAHTHTQAGSNSVGTAQETKSCGNTSVSMGVCSMFFPTPQDIEAGMNISEQAKKLVLPTAVRAWPPTG